MIVFKVETDGNGTLVIASLFVFIAYFLDPLVGVVFHRIRAYYAWRSVENKRYVDVTKHFFINKAFQEHGNWGASRIVTVSLVFFYTLSWVLELRLGLENIRDGEVDMFDRPPPVVYADANHTSWMVLGEDILNFDSIEDKGSLGNFENTLQVGSALSLYRTENRSKILPGLVETATWSNVSSDTYRPLSYDDENQSGTAYLPSLECDGSEDTFAVYSEDETDSWGEAVECSSGPGKYGTLTFTAPATIVLRSSEGAVYLLFEEEGSYPGFIYSVWTPKQTPIAWDEKNVTIYHEFHIASRFRLAEAIITGIVHGIGNGGGCVDLMLQHSHLVKSYESDETRARPFGEHPEVNYGVEDLQKVEPIEFGVGADEIAATCLMLLGAMTVVGIVWWLYIESSIDMDIYNRDELIRAATLPDCTTDGEPPSAMRILVGKDDNDRISVIVEHAGGNEHRYRNLRRRLTVVAQDDSAVAAVTNESDSNTVRARPGQVLLGSTNFSQVNGQRSVSLSSLAVSSAMCTPEHGSPAHDHELGVSRAHATAREHLESSTSTRMLGSSEIGCEESRPLHVSEDSQHLGSIAFGELSPETCLTPGRRICPALRPRSLVETPEKVDDHGPTGAQTHGSTPSPFGTSVPASEESIAPSSTSRQSGGGGS